MTLPRLFSETVRNFGLRPALAFTGQTPITYKDLEEQINAVICRLEAIGIEHGDKVAILATSSPNWAVCYYAITFMGAVAVPILPDFHETEIENIIVHSESKALFYSSGLKAKIKPSVEEMMPNRILIDNITADSAVKDVASDKLANEPRKDYTVEENDLAAIIYTSGTTGKSKGVMLSHKNICFTAQKGSKIIPIYDTDRFLSVLPLSHSYENTIGLILPMINGACVYYLGGLPTPSILLPALQEVKPTFMLTVPMIIEKIYRNKIRPAFTEKPVMRTIYSIPPFRKLLNRIAGKKLMATFGGELRFYGIGGAKLSSTIEKFLIEARFPYAIGYGLTETSPLLAGCSPSGTRLQSTGPALEEVTLKIHHPDPITGEGEIWAKGDNVMMGYYKEPEMTAEMITPDGWLKTGDLGIFDKDGYLFIQGRKKNTILGSGGENIYPEEIESVINNFKHVLESLVIEQKGKLVALVHFNSAEIEEKYLHMKHEVTSYVEQKIDELKIELKDYINSRVNKFSKVQSIENQSEPFQKTPTQKIKRFLYNTTKK
ncbi:MAG: AMP-binding protein [Bacteroidales bacterium]|nr:AMP-binding protein [Bacteroidales bacterium]